MRRIRAASWRREVKQKQRAVLLLGNYRPTLTIARTLARDGLHVILGLDHDGEGSAQYSNCVHGVWDHPPLDAAGGSIFKQELDALLAARPELDVIYPVTEIFVRWCAENEDFLFGRILVASPPAATVLCCLDKLRMVKLAQELGIPCRPFKVAASLSATYAAAGELGYPIAVRPLKYQLRLGNKKAIIARDRETLHRAMPAWPVGHDHVLVQQFAAGARHDIYFAAKDGKASRFLEVKVIRTDSPDGTGLTVDGEIVQPSPDLTDYVQRLLRRLGYTGIGCAQFLVDPATGKTSFLELNPRIAGSHRCTEVPGMDLTRLAITLAAGSSQEAQAPFSYQPGRRYAWTYGDVHALALALSQREIGAAQALRWVMAIAATFFRTDFHLTWDWRDPWPTLRLFLARAALLRRVVSRSDRQQATELAWPR